MLALLFILLTIEPFSLASSRLCCTQTLFTIMSELDPSTSDAQDQSQSTYSPRFCPSSPPHAPTVEIFSKMQQRQPQDAPKSPHFFASSPSPAPSSTAASAMPPSASPTLSPLAQKYPDAETYLMRPEVIALLASGSKEPKPKTILVSQTTSHHLPLLHQESQTRGLLPRFEIEGDQRMGFGGNVKVGDQTITSEERWQTKKAVKEALAEKAVGVVKAMPSVKRKRSVGESQENWIGMLHGGQLLPPLALALCSNSLLSCLARSFFSDFDYFGGTDHHTPTRSTTGGPIYLEYTHGTAFACTCKIPAHPNPFGSESEPLFPSKRAARSSAAKEAMQFLINQGLASLDGSCKAVTKKAKRDAAVAMAEDTEAAFAKKVNGM